MDRSASLPPDLIVASRSEAVEYLVAQSLLLLAISTVVVGFFMRSLWTLVVMLAFGLPAQLLRTRLANKIEARALVGRRSPGWWQLQLDRPTVARRAMALVRGEN